MKTIDARGLSCPEPVILTRKALASGDASYKVIVDNHASKENVTRFAEHQGCRVTVSENDGEYTLSLERSK
ncbi:MAG: sulfurtransferase TusA family protein [Stomatobaculum sp.]|jgi:TusA-related sulfurtransferase|nr:sulfurtransferase TusA family protein [Stomatobaculum sp.]